jgi:hypothetical protein
MLYSGALKSIYNARLPEGNVLFDLMLLNISNARYKTFHSPIAP